MARFDEGGLAGWWSQNAATGGWEGRLGHLRAPEGIREQIFKDEHELAHYANKKLLYHPDMPTYFLDRPEASLFKQLVGGDPLWADVKPDARKTLEGNFPVILACNGKPKIHLDSDMDAWMRRIVVLSFQKPEHETHLGKMSELITNEEASGIVHWLLEGWAKLWKDNLQLVQTSEQKARAGRLLVSSESPKAFARDCLKRQPDAIMGSADLYDHYQEWCREQSIPPFASQAFTQIVREEVEVRLGLRFRHDLPDGCSNCMRGWKGLGLIKSGNSTNTAETSEQTGNARISVLCLREYTEIERGGTSGAF